MRTTHAILTGLFAALLTACGQKGGSATGDPSATPDSMAVRYYKMRAAGQFDAYIAAMQSCDSTTPAYKQSVEHILRQHQAAINKEKQGVKQVEALRTELHDQGRMANVFLAVSYTDGTREEIMFPLVLDGGTWRIQ